MSRLDSFIARMQAQRDCLNFLKPAVHALPGPILEVGLGNGRTYDHLRDLFPGREIYVFERQVAAHPHCIPPDDRLFLGEAREAIPRAARQLGASAALIHTDLGTGARRARRARRLRARQSAARRGALAPPARAARRAGRAVFSVSGRLKSRAQRLRSRSRTRNTTAPSTEPMKLAVSPGP